MNNKIHPKEIVERHFEGTSYLVGGKKYHKALPNDLAEWYCYTADGGHSILALIEGDFDENSPATWEDHLCPCPVKSILRKYRILNGIPVAPLQYSSEIGLITEDGDDEY
jgi:hypothetical protein